MAVACGSTPTRRSHPRERATDMTEHAWTLENLAAYATDRLSPHEVERADRHVAGCKECRRALAELRELDQALMSLFAPVRPEPGMEDRMIEKLRTAPSPRRFRWTAGLRFLAGAAAVLL